MNKKQIRITAQEVIKYLQKEFEKPGLEEMRAIAVGFIDSNGTPGTVFLGNIYLAPVVNGVLNAALTNGYINELNKRKAQERMDTLEKFIKENGGDSEDNKKTIEFMKKLL